MFTASHNPAQYNGIKMCRAFASPDRPGERAGRDPGPGRRRRRPGPLTFRGRSRSRTCSPTMRRTSSRWRRCAVATSGWSWTQATGWPGSPPLRCSASWTSSWWRLYFELDGTFPHHEANPIEPANLVDLQAKVRRDRRRHRARLRRRRRPLLPGRRARRAGQPERADRADRRPGAGRGPGRHDHPQPDHLARRTGDRARAGRQAGADPGRALLHQGADGRDRSRLRRRALRTLLLPRLLARRLRDAGGAARPGRPGRDRPAALGAAAPLLPPRRQRGDQLRGARPAGGPRRARADLARTRRRGGRPPRRAHRHPRRLVVQCSRVQHRTPAAAERRGRGRSHHGAGPRRRPRRDQKEHR